MMSIVSKSILILRKAAALMLLPLLAWSCQLVTDDFDDETANISNAAQYINITISVSASESPVTRANPTGGEYGDGTVKGSDDPENKVNNITLIFFKDAAGLNTTATPSPEVLFVKKYDVHEASSTEVVYPKAHEHKNTEPEGYPTKEVIYTTGNQRLEETALEVGETYQVLVVANADPDIRVGDKVNSAQTDGRPAVRDMVLNHAFTSVEGSITNVNNFVMTSENPASVTLSSPTIIEEENKFIYYFDCIHIERLAARIDFDTDGGEYYNNTTDDSKSGYKYIVSGGNIFVVTKVIPFNLYNESEYLFKRVQDAWSGTITTTYLGDETMDNTPKANNYVVDPHTAEKNNTNTYSYLSPIAQSMSDTYTQTMNSEANKNGGIITLCYTKENTLMPTSYLKKYATGIAFEGDYYQGSVEGTPEHRVYYHYIRHQGEQSTEYEAKQWNELINTQASAADTPMNIGIVRNNIYRISIKGEGLGTLKIQVQETKWRHVDNPTIYI